MALKVAKSRVTVGQQSKSATPTTSATTSAAAQSATTQTESAGFSSTASRTATALSAATADESQTADETTTRTSTSVAVNKTSSSAVTTSAKSVSTDKPSAVGSSASTAKVVTSPATDPAVDAVKKSISSGEKVSPSAVGAAAQSAIKSAQTAVRSADAISPIYKSAPASASLSSAGVSLSTSAQKTQSSSGSGAGLGASALKPTASSRGASSSGASSRRTARPPSGSTPPSDSKTESRSFSHAISWAATPASERERTSVNQDRHDFVYDYGLYLLRPEIITLYDSDPLYTPEGVETSAASFSSLQTTTAKSMQEASYQKTRALLSSLPYLSTLGFNESDLGALEEVGYGEESGVSLFEQAIAKWDADRSSVSDFETLTADRALVAQNIASTLDLANLPTGRHADSVSYFDTLATFASYAVNVVEDAPTASKYATAAGEANAHVYTRYTVDAQPLIKSLLGITTGKDISGDFTSYSLMHSLMQESFINFAFGTTTDGSSRYGVKRSDRESTDASYAYRQDTTTTHGKIAGDLFFRNTSRLASDFAANMNEASSLSSTLVAQTLMTKIAGLAAYRGSSLYDANKTALDVFSEKIGLPVGIAGSKQGTGKAIEDFEKSPAASSAASLFQVASESGSYRLMYFDRSHNPGLPGGYVHGYSELFGNTGRADAAAGKLRSSMIRSIDLHSEIINFLAGNVYTSEGYKKAADIPHIVLNSFADLIKKNDASSPEGGLGSYDSTGAADAYTDALRNAGTARGTGLRIEGRSNSTIDAVSTGVSTVFADFEILYFISMGNELTTALNGWQEKAVGLLMSKWDQSFNYLLVPDRTYPSSIDGEDFYTTSILESDIVKGSLSTLIGEPSLLLLIEAYGTSSMLRIASWSIELARKIFASETDFTSDPGAATIRSIFPNARDRNYHSFKDICLLLTAFACFHIKSMFKPPKRGIVGSNTRMVSEFSDSAADVLNKIYSHTAVSYDDARLCLALINGQLASLRTGLQRMTTSVFEFDTGDGATKDLLIDGKFSPIYTPCQAGALTVRKVEFLARRRKSPFHSLRYDEMSQMRIYERDAIKSLYATNLMKLDDTRVLFVGVPAGIQHVMGTEQRFVKVIIARRDQTQADYKFTPISYIFDMYAFVSPSVCEVVGSAPWRQSGTYGTSLPTMISDLTIFNTSLSATSANYGNLRASTARSISTPLLTQTISQSSESQKVQISDLIVTFEFLDSDAVVAETGYDQTDSTNPLIAGSHLVDYLLKTHVRNMSGLDFSESTYTTSRDAFNPNLELDETRSYVFNVCTVDFINMTRASDSLAFKTDVKALDLLSRTPIIRSAAYADLCRQPTLFDRVFAVPVNLRMFSLTVSTSS